MSTGSPPPPPRPSREDLAALDRTDPLAPRRELFRLPEGVIYLDGNSLGPVTHAAAERVARVVDVEWGEGLIRSWNEHGWIDLPHRVGAKIARLVGADDDEVIVADSTSINLYKLVAAALGMRPGRRVVVSESRNFPTDLYMIQGLLDLLDRDRPGGDPSRNDPPKNDAHELRLLDEAPSPDDITAALDDSVALLCLTQVDYRSGRLHDLAAVTERAHAAGALVLWDLAHSAGALEVDLGAAGADFAIGCGYKYLNGGPGAPAFLHVARRHQEAARTPLQGWLGHAAPFEFTREYVPAPGIDRFQCGTPPVLSLAALDAALDAFGGVAMADVRDKSRRLGDLFLELVEERCAGHGLEIACPRDADERGSQVSLAHPEGYAIVQALIARGVIGDFRAPNVLRFGFAPLYLRFVDVWDAVEALAEILEGREWDREEFRRRGVVT